jgi:fructose-1,6-bisphosphatase/inositol monophosphatase family enzyme
MHSKGQLSLIRRVAIDAAIAAGALIHDSYGKTLLVDSVVAHDLKLRLDRMSEETIITIIHRGFPDHGMLSEEMGYVPGVAPFLWIVDPLDGTVNFFHGVPFFCTCVSCHEIEEKNDYECAPLLPDGRAIGSALVGVVYSPLQKELFVGVLDGGAFLNGETLSVKPVADLSQTIVSLSFGARDGSATQMNRLLPRMVERAQKVRTFGSTALDIAFVAAGRIGAFIHLGTNLWDFAAAARILEEAGGVIDAEQYASGRWKIIASNPGIFAEVRRLQELES